MIDPKDRRKELSAKIAFYRDSARTHARQAQLDETVAEAAERELNTLNDASPGRVWPK